MASKRSLLCLVSVVVAMTGGTPTAQDVNAILQTVGKTIGADNLRCVTYSGSGYVGAVGQNYTPRDDWPRIELASYTKTVNFDAKSAREEQVRRQGTFPARGGGGIPIQGEDETVYSNYRDFGPVKFPARVHHHDDLDDTSSGNPVVRGGHHKERILIEADMYTPPAAGMPPPPTAAAKTFLNNVQRLKLDVSTIVPIHGAVVPWGDFMKHMGTQ
jgi:hypothetical protein